MFEYNTKRKTLVLREYGRNVQNLVRYIAKLKDKSERNLKVLDVLKIMKAINPKVRSISEESPKLWDDLFIISDYNLDIDSPFKMPERNSLNKKISRLNYKTDPVKFRHYGRNVELLVQKASSYSDVETQEKLILIVMRIMRGFNGGWNNDGSDIDLIIDNIKNISEKKLLVDFQKLKVELHSMRYNKYKNRFQKNYKS